MFQNKCIQSAYWHKFATTFHSPIGKNPAEFGIKVIGPEFKGFAQNDLFHEDPTGAKHELYTKGLNLALNNYLNGTGFDIELQKWFDFEVSQTNIAKNLIERYLIS